MNMGRREAQLLRDLAMELSTRVSGELSVGPTRERLRFAALMLTRMAADLDLEPDVVQGLLGDYDEARRKALSALGDNATVAALWPDREALGLLVQELAAADDTRERRTALAEIVNVEVTRRQRLDTRIAHAGQRVMVGAKKNNVFEMVTPESVTTYLLNTFPDPGLEATEVKVLPGGRSKYTIFITLKNATSLPPQLVMRQDTGSGHIPTDIVDEFPLLQVLAKAGLAVPKPLHIERETTALGGAFIFVDRIDGVMAGDYFSGMKHLDERMAIDIASTLGKMHSLDIASFDIERVSDSDYARDHLVPLIEFYRARWRRDAMEPSPLVESGYAWLLRQAKRSDGRAVLVHGDVGSHNLLHKDGRLAAILDWELFHIGDAGEDLGYCRQFIEPIMPWGDFLQRYREAGGEVVDERRILMGTLWGLVRNSTFSAASAREYYTGEADDFTQGAFGYFVLAKMEALMAPIVKRVWDMEIDADRWPAP